MAEIYRMERIISGQEGQVLVFADNALLDPGPSLQVISHSPTGFEWGYGGSGPSQLALAILLDFFGEPSKAKQLYQDFKWKFIAHAPMEGFVVRAEEIKKWLAEGNHA
jgi:hypothetical protein